MYDYREELLTAVEAHQVLIVVAETGSGKTTQARARARVQAAHDPRAHMRGACWSACRLPALGVPLLAHRPVGGISGPGRMRWQPAQAQLAVLAGLRPSSCPGSPQPGQQRCAASVAAPHPGQPCTPASPVPACLLACLVTPPSLFHSAGLAALECVPSSTLAHGRVAACDPALGRRSLSTSTRRATPRQAALGARSRAAWLR